MQSAIVIVIVAVALLYVVYRKVGPVTKGQVPSCGCGCSGCGSSGGCADFSPRDLRSQAEPAPGPGKES